MWLTTQLESSIREDREKKAEIDRRLVALREIETYQHIVADGTYRGTAAAIASRLNEEEGDLSWIEDSITPSEKLPLTEQEITMLSKYLLCFEPEVEDQLRLSIPDPSRDLPETDYVRTHFYKEKAALQKVHRSSRLFRTIEGRALAHANSDLIETVLSDLEDSGCKRRNLCTEPDAVDSTGGC